MEGVSPDLNIIRSQGWACVALYSQCGKIGYLNPKLHIHNLIPHVSNNHYVAVGSNNLSESSHLMGSCYSIANIIDIVLEMQERIRELYECGCTVRG